MPATVGFLRGVCHTPFPLTPPRPPAHACSTPTSAASTYTMESMYCSHASASSFLMDSPLETPGFCLTPFPVVVPRAFDASDLVSDHEVPFPCLQCRLCMSCPLRDFLLMLLLPHLQTVRMKFTFRVNHPVLLCFHEIVMTNFLFPALCFLVPPLLPVPLITLVLPHRLVGEADGFLSMVSNDLLLLLLLCEAPLVGQVTSY
jgi:hypothetical protein